MAGPLFGALRPSLSPRLARLRRRRGERPPAPWRDWGRSLLRIGPYLRPYWPLAGGAGAMIGVSSLLALLAPWPLAILVDTVLGQEPLPSLLGGLAGGIDRTTLLVIAVVGGLLLTAGDNGIAVANDYVTTKLDQRMVLDFRTDLFRHAQRLSLAFHDQRSTGTLMYQINNQAGALGAVTVMIPPLAQSLLTLGGMFFVAYQIDPGLALLSLSVVPFVYYSTGYYARRIEPRLLHVRNLEGQSLSIVHEAMSMLRVIVAFGRESHEHRRFREHGEHTVDQRVKLTVRQTVFSLAVNTITAAGTALVLGFGAWRVLGGDLTVGELLVVMGYIAAIYQPLEQISGTVASLQEQFVALRHALGLLDTEPEVEDAPDAIELGRARGDVEFERVSFSYAGRKETLVDVSFAAAAGQRVAIVGPTGAGKTTLVSLLPRFYDPREGRVLLDGIDIRRVQLASLREQISIVLQEPLLFSGTIADNIRYGRLDASEEELVEAARAANAHDFVERLPNGYATRIGERGAQLSGGERQRICVARAFLKDAPVLILDEPTSAIDSRTEAVILEALERLMEGRTTFMIAHRLSTVRRADLILVLDGGRIVDRGTHEELLARDGLYRHLHEAQTGPAARARDELESAADRLAAATRDGSNGALPEAEGASEAAWLVVGAVWMLVMEGSPDALRALAVRRADPHESVAQAARLADAVLRDVGLAGEADDAEAASGRAATFLRDIYRLRTEGALTVGDVEEALERVRDA